MSDFLKHISNVLSKLRRCPARLVLALIVLLCHPLSAQELSTTEHAQLQAQKEALFQQTLRDPGNLDVAFAYADLAAKLGDNEAAVSALERMLLFNPNLPRVQLELGALYFRMGSYEIARTYFDEAAAANPPPDVKARIENYQAAISRLSAPQQFSGVITFGAQYQSDANIAGSSAIATPFAVINLLPQFVKQSDVLGFASTSVLYSYDLGTQTRDTLEIGGTGYGNHYATVERLNLGIVEATAGPRFNFPDPLPGVSSASLKPYLITNYVSLGTHPYFDTLGVGGEATALVWDDMRLKSWFEFRQKNFWNAADRPLSRGFNGSDKLLSVLLVKPIALVPDSELSFQFDFLDQNTRPLPDPVALVPYYSNDTYAGTAAYRVRYRDPSGWFRLPLEADFYLSRSWSLYAGPDPCCAVTSNRYDQHWRFGIVQNIPITADISFVLQLQRDVVSSNVPLYHYTSNSVLGATQIHF